MGIFDSPAEKERKKALSALEDKRLAFAQKMEKLGYMPEKSLYGQKEGGFRGVALLADQVIYISAPGPMEEGDFSHLCCPRDQIKVTSEEVYIKPEGMGGVFGFGKRGAKGFRLHLSFPDGQEGEVEIVSGLNSVLVLEKGPDPVFSTKRRRGDGNVVWDFKPLEPRFVETIHANWMGYLGG